MPAPVEQRHVEVLFEFLHRVGDRRRHSEQFLCCGGEAAPAVDRVQYLQRLEREFHGTDSHGKLFRKIE